MNDALKQHWPEYLIEAAGIGLFMIAAFMTVILCVSNNQALHKITGICGGLLVVIYITLEAPISGMSMNPARTLSSALAGNSWAALWIYFTAPVIGMLGAAEVFLRTRGSNAVGCAKLHHQNSQRCIFCGKPKGSN